MRKLSMLITVFLSVFCVNVSHARDYIAGPLLLPLSTDWVVSENQGPEVVQATYRNMGTLLLWRFTPRGESLGTFLANRRKDWDWTTVEERSHPDNRVGMTYEGVYTKPGPALFRDAIKNHRIRMYGFMIDNEIYLLQFQAIDVQFDEVDPEFQRIFDEMLSLSNTPPAMNEVIPDPVLNRRTMSKISGLPKAAPKEISDQDKIPKLQNMPPNETIKKISPEIGMNIGDKDIYNPVVKLKTETNTPLPVTKDKVGTVEKPATQITSPITNRVYAGDDLPKLGTWKKPEYKQPVAPSTNNNNKNTVMLKKPGTTSITASTPIRVEPKEVMPDKTNIPRISSTGIIQYTFIWDFADPVNSAKNRIGFDIGQNRMALLDDNGVAVRSASLSGKPYMSNGNLYLLTKDRAHWIDPKTLETISSMELQAVLSKDNPDQDIPEIAMTTASNKTGLDSDDGQQFLLPPGNAQFQQKVTVDSIDLVKKILADANNLYKEKPLQNVIDFLIKNESDVKKSESRSIYEYYFRLGELLEESGDEDKALSYYLEATRLME